jgi:acetoin utilization protein AcuB
VKVSQYMTRKLHTVRPDEGVRNAFFRMRQERIRHLPVVTEDGHLAGWISDRDMRRPDWADPHVDLGHEYQLDDNLQVKDLMNPNPVALHTYDSLHKAVALLRERRFGAVPVLDKDEALVGVLSSVDLLEALADVLDAQHAARGRG